MSILFFKIYHIGVIANQSPGTVSRLDHWGLLQYIDVVVASAELGIAKPDERIFRKALELANCLPEHAVMIGDRLDNDIYPAKQLGMKAVWVKQGFVIYQHLDADHPAPDYTVNGLSELLEIFSSPSRPFPHSITLPDHHEA